VRPRWVGESSVARGVGRGEPRPFDAGAAGREARSSTSLAGGRAEQVPNTEGDRHRERPAGHDPEDGRAPARAAESRADPAGGDEGDEDGQEGERDPEGGGQRQDRDERGDGSDGERQRRGAGGNPWVREFFLVDAQFNAQVCLQRVALGQLNGGGGSSGFVEALPSEQPDQFGQLGLRAVASSWRSLAMSARSVSR